MLLDHFFTIQSSDKPEINGIPGVSGERYRVTVALNPAHPVFKGHFPGNPVVPGVCQVQMVTESLQSVTGMKRFLKEADNIKFLSMINPMETSTLLIDLVVKPLPENKMGVQASLSGNNLVFFKLKGVFS